MNFEEFAAKPLLAKGGIPVPPSRIALTADEAAEAARAIGPCVVKAQVPTGKRGKAGGIKLASTPEDARAHAEHRIFAEQSEDVDKAACRFAGPLQKLHRHRIGGAFLAALKGHE